MISEPTPAGFSALESSLIYTSFIFLYSRLTVHKVVVNSNPVLLRYANCFSTNFISIKGAMHRVENRSESSQRESSELHSYRQRVGTLQEPLSLTTKFSRYFYGGIVLG